MDFQQKTKLANIWEDKCKCSEKQLHFMNNNDILLLVSVRLNGIEIKNDFCFNSFGVVFYCCYSAERI